MTEDVIYIIEDYLDQLDIVSTEYGWTTQQKECARFAAERLIFILNKKSDDAPLIVLEELRDYPWLITGEWCGRFLLWNMTEIVCQDIISYLVG